MRAGNNPVRWLVLALVLASAAAHADYRDAYSRGLAALKDGNYAEARRLFEQALAEQPEPALRVRLYGQRWEPYLPQHYLGEAAFRLGDCATALAQWNVAANQQITAQLSEIRSAQQRDAAACEQKLTAQKEAPAKLPLALPEKPAAPAVAEGKPVVAPAQKESVPPAVARSEPALRDEPSARSEPARAERPAAEKKVVEAARPALSRPPAPLAEAFERYLNGRYAEVGRIDPESYADQRARFHAYLVRAAARFTLGEISGDKDLIESARVDARAARALDAKRAPDTTLFSPRFRAFFRDGG